MTGKKKQRLPGTVKAAYIYTILPPGISGAVLNTLSGNQNKKLNTGLSRIEDLKLSDKSRILRMFIRGMNALREERNRIINQSISLSLVTLSVIVLAGFIYGILSYSNADRTIDFIESILNNGGLHVILFPFLAGYFRARYGKSPLSLLLKSENHPLDAGFSLVGALVISLMFVLTLEPGTPVAGNPVITVFTLAASVTAAPAVEELFFRYMVFLRGGKKYGHIPSALFSSLLFSLVHLPDTVPLFMIYTGSGFILCGLAWYRRSLFPAFLAHALANFIIQVV